MASLPESQSIEDQRRVLIAFCKRIVADAESREIVVETDLTRLAQSKTLPGVLTGLPDSALPDLAAGEIQQPALADGLPDSTLRASEPRAIQELETTLLHARLRFRVA